MPLLVTIKPFTMLTARELYDILKLRSEVFVVEQNCVYQDIDDIDLKSYMIFATLGRKTVATARVFTNPNNKEEAVIGRVVTTLKHRRKGYGDQILEAAEKVAKENLMASHIMLHAQCQARLFYEQRGYRPKGEVFLEDGIPHIEMSLEL